MKAETYKKFDQVIELMQDQFMSLIQALRHVQMSQRTFYDIIDQSDEYKQKYARATQLRADALFDEIIQIADDPSGDFTFKDDGSIGIDHENIQRSKLRVDARKWALSKMMPKKYGDRVTNEHVGEDGKPIQIERVDPFKKIRENEGL